MKRKIGTILSIIGGTVFGGIIGVTLVRIILNLIPILGEIIKWISNSTFSIVFVLLLVSAVVMGIGIYLEER